MNRQEYLKLVNAIEVLGNVVKQLAARVEALEAKRGPGRPRKDQTLTLGGKGGEAH